MPTTLKHIKELVNQIDQRTMSIMQCANGGNFTKAKEHFECRRELKDELAYRVEGLLVVKELYEEVQGENASHPEHGEI